MFLAQKHLTSYVLVSKPIFQPAYNEIVHYATFLFYQSVTKNYFGIDFYSRHDMVPIMNGVLWRQIKKKEFMDLVYKLGDPLYEYNAPLVKKVFWIRKCPRIQLSKKDF